MTSPQILTPEIIDLAIKVFDAISTAEETILNNQPINNTELEKAILACVKSDNCPAELLQLVQSAQDLIQKYSTVALSIPPNSEEAETIKSIFGSLFNLLKEAKERFLANKSAE